MTYDIGLPFKRGGELYYPLTWRGTPAGIYPSHHEAALVGDTLDVLNPDAIADTARGNTDTIRCPVCRCPLDELNHCQSCIIAEMIATLDAPCSCDGAGCYLCWTIARCGVCGGVLGDFGGCEEGCGKACPECGVTHNIQRCPEIRVLLFAKESRTTAPYELIA